MFQEPLSDSPLGYILRNWKILTLQKAWAQYKLGDQKKKKASEWYIQFSSVAQSTQIFATP